MSNQRILPRRHLLKWAGIGATALAVGTPLPGLTAEGGSQTNPGEKAQLLFGICGRMTNARMLKDAGCDYIEEGVGGLLMPEKGDDEFHEFTLKDLVHNVEHFGFIAGYQKKIYREEDPVNIKAVPAWWALRSLPMAAVPRVKFPMALAKTKPRNNLLRCSKAWGL